MYARVFLFNISINKNRYLRDQKYDGPAQQGLYLLWKAMVMGKILA